MNVFVTGATGVLGKATVRQLVKAGHKVFALSRSPKNAELLRHLGAQMLAADLFERDSLIKALKNCQAEAILHLATKVPPTMRMGKLSAWQENDHIRRDGTRVVIDAALVTQVKTVVYPSFYFVYPDQGQQWIDAASTPLPSHPAQVVLSTLDAEAEMARFTEAGRTGIALRMGTFYGPEATSAREQLQMARQGFFALPGSRDAYIPLIWVDDAASALITALDGVPASIYDIVDDVPLTRDELSLALARAVGKQHLWHIPQGIVKLLTGVVFDAAKRSQRISNRRFRELTDWKPKVPNAYEGWHLMTQAEKEVQHA